MSSDRDGNDSPVPPAYSNCSKSMEDDYAAAEKTANRTSLNTVKWHSAPSATVFKSTAVIEVAAGGAAAAAGGWKPLQRQKVVTAAPTLEDDDDGRPTITFPPDSDTDGASVGGGVAAADRIRKRSVTVRRGYSCQETCAARRQMTTGAGGGTAVTVTAAVENRRRWLSADTGTSHAAPATGNSRSMECLPSPAQPSAHHRTSFIMAAEDRKSLDSGLDDVAAAELADRRRGMFASTRTSVPSHLSLAIPSCERRLTILSPHTHTPNTPAAAPPAESAWHFCTSSMQSSSHVAVISGRSRKKSRPGMVLPRLVLPGSSDLDIFSQ